MPKTRSVEGLSVEIVAGGRTCPTFPLKFQWTCQRINNKIVFIQTGKSKGKVRPRTGHEGTEGRRGLVVLFLQPWH